MVCYARADAGRELCLGLVLLRNTLILPLKSALTRTYPWDSGPSNWRMMTSGLGANTAHVTTALCTCKNSTWNGLLNKKHVSLEQTSSICYLSLCKACFTSILQPYKRRRLWGQWCLWDASHLSSSTVRRLNGWPVAVLRSNGPGSCPCEYLAAVAGQSEMAASRTRESMDSHQPGRHPSLTLYYNS